MCLAVPMRVQSIDDQTVTVELNGVTQQARGDLLEEVAVGDYVLVHAGFAITRLDENEARDTLALFAALDGPEVEPADV